MDLFLSSHFEHFQLDVSIFAVAFTNDQISVGDGINGFTHKFLPHPPAALLCCDILLQWHFAVQLSLQPVDYLPQLAGHQMNSNQLP